MKTTVSKPFFRAFGNDGVVKKCIDYVLYINGLDPILKKLSDKRDKYYYKKKLPEEILKEAEEFNFSAIYGNEISPLIEEIDKNLNERMGDNAKRIYVFLILRSFGPLCETFHPANEIQSLEEDILSLEELARSIRAYKPEGYEEHLKQCNELISEDRIEINRLKEIESLFTKIAYKDSYKPGSVEDIFSHFVRVKDIFANKLDILLLLYGIDLLELQEEIGIYLKTTRSIDDILEYVGSRKFAEKCISKYEVQDIKEYYNKLPDVLKEVFNKAAEMGLITIEDDAYKWNNTKQLLAYFADKASIELNLGKTRNGEKTINWRIFEKIFNVTNLKSAKQDWMKIYTSFSPPGYEKVDALF